MRLFMLSPPSLRGGRDYELDPAIHLSVHPDRY
jgi:hypothetical protein